MNSSIKYHLANLIFCPTTKTVTKQDGSIEKLRPQRASILALFIEYKGQLVTSELLHSRIWKNRKVEDKTVQAALTKLRTSLGWQADENLINERSEGYRLVCEVIAVNDPTDSQVVIAQTVTSQTVAPQTVIAQTLAHKAVKKSGITSSVYAAIAVFAIVTIALITMQYFTVNANQPEKVKEFKTKPITYIKGQELKPSLSPNGKYLAFTHAKNKTLQYQIKVKLLSNNKFLSLDDAAFSSSPRWSANGLTLYYQAFENEECFIKKVQLIDKMMFSKAEVITSCGKEKSESPVAVDKSDEWLYFSYKTAPNKAMYLKRIHLITGKEQQLTSPTEDAYGDYSLSLSPDGTMLAILAFDAAANGRVYTLNLQTKEQILAFTFKHLLYNVDWAKQGKSLFYIDQDAYIVQFDLNNKTHKQITKLSQSSQTIQVIENGDFLVGFGEFYISDLYKSSLDSYKTVQLQESHFNDHSITSISDSPEQYAFVSNRSGLQQIWLYDNGSLKQLTDYKKQLLIKELSLSSDNTSLVYLANSSINVINIGEQIYQKVTNNEVLFRSPIWHCSSETILATTKVNDVWSLAEIIPSTGTVNILSKGITSIKADCNNDKYYVAQEEKLGIYLLSRLPDTIQKTPLLADYYFGSGKQWLVENDIAYFVEQRALYSMSLKTSTKPQAQMNDENLIGFNVSAENIYFSKKVLNDSYIAQISAGGSKRQ
ncbi:winged helix-turn-helix domain-containing protein [Colwellia psychrerythraea]|uniref:Transcriptional regulator, winged helix family n=1 Tax=Colwellia psychrerythraea TaxID=28229 RepID=A0A099KKC7_COLPS|nr:winged helix-turn-helix domain-containing protein [Colwellia psychrerythraea]KGJ90412.1 transcriptional regulator, winged helix family [Colwellia psychrerythraea]